MAADDTTHLDLTGASPEGAAIGVVRTPRHVLLVGGVLSALTGLVALAGIGIAVAGFAGGDMRQVVWFLMLWEVVALVAAIFSALAGLTGRFSSGPAMAFLIAAGAAFVGAVLSETAIVTQAMGRGGQWNVVAGIRLAPLMSVQLGLAGLLGVCAALAVLMRAPRRAVPSLVIGVLLLAPPMAGLAALGMVRFRGPLLSWVGNHVVVGTALIGLVSVVLAGLLCVGVHKVIRAFELGIAAGLVKPGGAGASDKAVLEQKAPSVEAGASRAE